MDDSWFQKHRYYIAGIGFILLSVSILGVPVIGYSWGIWSETVMQVLMSGMSVAGTLLLATLTFLTLIDNRILIQERVKERKKPLQRDMIENIVRPSISIIDKNETKLKQESFDWLEADYTNTDDFEFVNIDMYMIGMRRDPVMSSRFADEFPDVADEMVKYDEYLTDLDACAFKYITECREAISEYIEMHEISNRNDEIIDADEVLNFLLIGDIPSRDDERPDWWVNHKQEFKRIAAENTGKYYDQFHKCKRKVFNYTNQVRKSLLDVRKSIEPAYGIKLESNHEENEK